MERCCTTAGDRVFSATRRVASTVRRRAAPNRGWPPDWPDSDAVSREIFKFVASEQTFSARFRRKTAHSNQPCRFDRFHHATQMGIARGEQLLLRRAQGVCRVSGCARLL
jgi:hypothetical protein